MFTARYALSSYIKQIRFVFKGLNIGTSRTLMTFSVVSLEVTDKALILQIPSGLKPHFRGVGGGRGLYFCGKTECGRGTKPKYGAART
jgi:hypothetical protein